MANPTGYSRAQIMLHWIIAALIVLQYVLHEGIVRVMDALEKGTEVVSSDMLLSRVHVISGTLILLLAIWRVVLRRKHGAPAAPEGESAALKMVAKATHVILYAVIFMMPISGLLTWFVSAETFGAGHAIGRVVLLVMVLLHILGALYHKFVLKSGVMERMLKAETK